MYTRESCILICVYINIFALPRASLGMTVAFSPNKNQFFLSIRCWWEFEIWFCITLTTNFEKCRAKQLRNQSAKLLFNQNILFENIAILPKCCLAAVHFVWFIWVVFFFTILINFIDVDIKRIPLPTHIGQLVQHLIQQFDWID